MIGNTSDERLAAAVKAHREAPRTRGMDTSGPMRAALAAADALILEEESVDRAARAICAAEFPEVAPAYAWNVQFEDGQNHYRGLARAALAAAVGDSA